MDSEKSQDEALAAQIKQIAEAVKADSNPDGLEHLKKLIKKNVPFSLRGYFMAYLFRESLQQTGRRPQRPQRMNHAPQSPAGQAAAQENGSENSSAQDGQHEQKPLPEGAKTLYLNIGKMKRLYGRQLSQIIQDAIGCTKDDIYLIRIHDKYSFVSMSAENCEKAIEKLNGTDINGRTVTVTYSNKE